MRLSVHPENPQRRFMERASEVLSKHGVVILPTDTTYSLTAQPGSRQALDRIARIKQIDPDKHLFSLIVPDLSDVARFAVVDNPTYRLLRHYLPGPYTFVLPASHEVPRLLLAKRRTIGLRVPDHNVPREVARLAGGVLLATTVKLPGEEDALVDPDEIEERTGKLVDIVMDAGWGGAEPSTIIDLSTGEPVIVREGRGDPEPFR